MMRYIHRVAGLKLTVGAAGLVTGVILSGGISGTLGPAPQALVTLTGAPPPVSGPVTSSGTGPLPGMSAERPPTVGLMAIVITDPPGPDPGPKAVVTANVPGTGVGAKTIVITDNGGDGPGPKAVVIPGGGPPPL
jgi:hypothetical protein